MKRAADHAMQRSLVSLAVVVGSYAAIGPVADLEISNVDISPDGFTRAAVLAGGTFPGPLIRGNMVGINASGTRSR